MSGEPWSPCNEEANYYLAQKEQERGDAIRKRTQTMIYVGIDPGLSGAVGAVDATGKFIGVWDTPTIKVKKGKGKKTITLPEQMAAILEDLRLKHREPSVCLEFVRAMPGQGVSSMFSIGRGVGQWEGIIAGLGLPSIQATPQLWKKQMLPPGVGKDKQASIAAALAALPAAAPHLTLKKHDGRAEALLLALFHQRFHPR